MEADEEEAKERQENELQVLQSIFMEDVLDLRKEDPWKVWRPLDVEILLRPQQSMSDHAQEVHAQISMCVKCFRDYPNRSPSIDLKNAKGLSKTQIQDLKKQLISLAGQLKGEVMILELSQHVQKFLHAHNKPGFQSFYEEMLCNQRRQEEELAKEEFRKLEVERKQQELQQQAIQEEIRRKQDALKEEARKRRTHIMRISETISDDENSLRNSTAPVSMSSSPKRDLSCRRCSGSSEPELPKLVTFHSGHDEKSLQLLKCLGHSCRGSSTFIAIDLLSGGDLFAVTEWPLLLSVAHSNRKKITPDDASILKQINSLEQEMSTISKIRHKNLIQYIGFNQEKMKDRIIIHIVQEFVPGNTLASFLNQSIPLDVTLLRHYTQEIVTTLEFLHNASIIHRDLRASSIFIDNSGTIRIGKYSLDKKLSDLCCPSSPHLNDYPLTFGKGGKKGDIYRLGIILLSLSVGKLVTDLVPKIPIHLNSSLKDFLQKCLQPNEHERWTSEQLLKHPFIHDPLQSIPTQEKSDSDNEKNKAEELDREPSLLPMMSSHLSGRSRIQTEFEVLQWLGKGGFGDVLKVRNKLDGRHYAIKKISLNPSRQQLNRKIMREVKLLSRLNHENVVRYYNSWIETTTEQAKPEEESSSCGSSQIIPDCDLAKVSVVGTRREPSVDEVEKLAPPKVEGSVEWSVSIEISSHPSHAACQEDSSDDEEDMDDVFGTSFLSHSMQDSVIFDHSTEQDSIVEEDSKPTLPSTSEESEVQRSFQFMYIQMEFCERSTLRIAIDKGLHKEVDRMWRLFREIIEGLGHIHQQGMIHRDLKPVNIFLDVNDHVKIGDFGLATTDIIQKAPPVADGVSSDAPPVECDVSHSDLLGDGSTTGAVGTALYLAPELLAPSSSRILYSQKVDLYSLGIIFFEMCYPAPSTGMERVKLLVNLRQREIVLPGNYLECLNPEQVHLIRWLLPHNPAHRPTAEELLYSDCLPPPLLEEAELNEMLRHTVSNPQSKGYKRMMAALFRQRLAPATDFSYDMDVHKATVRQSLAFHRATSVLQEVMQKHGAVQLQVPTLMPKASHAHQQSEANVRLMDHGGALVTLPINLRVSFARFIARREVGHVKRYALEKVYREKKVYGCHPRELYECAFDIVTPSSDNLLPDAEVLAIVSEVISEFPVLQNRNYYVRINHFGLLRAILMHCGIAEEKYMDICLLLVEYKLKGLSKFQMGNQLTNLGLSDQAMTLLFQFTEPEESVQKIALLFKSLTKRKGQAALLAGQSLRELQTIINYAENLGLKVPVIVSPGFAYESCIYSGMVFQFVCELSKKGRKGRMDVLAAGGRYDHLVSSFRLSPTVANGTATRANAAIQSQSVSSAVGVSIAIEKIITAVLEEEEMPGVLDVMVCSVGNSAMIKDKCTLLRSLWTANVHAHAIYEPESLEEATDFCKENRVTHLLILKESELGTVKVRTFDKDRFSEKKIALNEFVEFAPKFLNSKCELSEGVQTFRLEQSRSSSSVLDGRDSGDQKPNPFSVTSSSASISVTFMALDEKITGSAKRRIEAQLQGHMQSLLPLLSGRVCVEVLVVELASLVVKTIASQLELDSEHDIFQSSLRTITEKYPRHRKYLTRLAEHIHDLRFEKRCPVIVLYSSVDNTFKVLL